MAAGPKPRRGPATRTPWMPPGRGPCPSSAPRAGASQAVLAAGSGAPLAPSRFSRLPSTGLSRPPRSKSVPKKKVVGAASASTSASPTLPNFSAMEASNLSGDYSAENMFDEMPTRGIDCPETSNSEAAVTCLPDDALVEILSYLCAKTLCRFKCVSKAWCRLITDVLLRGKSLQTLQGFFYGGGSDNYGDFADLPGGSAPPFDRSFSFLTQQVGIQYIFLLDSCNGLLLFGHRKDPVSSLGYIVCNPTTEQCVAVPSSAKCEPFEHQSSCTFLIFDPAASSEFKLLQLWMGTGDAGGADLLV